MSGAGPVRRSGPSTLTAAAVAIALFVAAFFTVSCSGETGQGEVTVRIPAGSSTAEIARILKADGVIASEKELTKKVEEMGVAGDLKPGTYRFSRGESLEGIIEKLTLGLQASESVLTVPEGFSIADIAGLVAEKTTISEEAYLKAAKANGRQLPLGSATGAASLEGFLFPSTYDIEPGMDAGVLVERQLERFKSRTASVEWGRAQALGITAYQALVVASLIEREAKIADERALVAAVIYNRLAAGMKLEVDATVQYALGYWKQELTQDDLDIESPFNTRLYKGLPPGPICNPGLDSINAALNPENVDYLYYVANGDREGSHFFTSSYDEFLQAKEESGSSGR